MSHRLQGGIYFEPNTKPRPYYRLLLLNVIAGASTLSVHATLSGMRTTLRELQCGKVRELEGQPAELASASLEQFQSLDFLLGFGRRFFDDGVHRPPLTGCARPEFLSYLPDPAFPMLPWAPGARPGTGEADIAIQLTADRLAAVECAAVEIWKLIVDEALPLEVVASFSGFGRHDGRGWLEFRDGVSNIEASQRFAAIEAAADPAWMDGGTYMAFLRLAIDLSRWRHVPRDQQELIVGRSKLSGSAIAAARYDSSGRPTPVVPEPLGAAATPEERAEWRDPPQTVDRVLEASHIHRANQNRTSPSAPGSLRIFRQGYDYLDGLGVSGPALGLNFVSFQSDLRVIQHMLHLPGWLGDVNFGGRPNGDNGDDQAPSFITVAAGGLYGVPPQAEPFPGAALVSG